MRREKTINFAGCSQWKGFINDPLPTLNSKYMKKSHFLAIIVVAVGVAVLISASRDVTTYANFTSAAKSGEKVKLVGQLVKDRPVNYDPEKNPDFMSFYLEDEEGQIRKVNLHSGKPQDFERSEQIVLTGRMEGKEFEASEMLLKCPSKYKDQEVYIRSQEEK